MSRFRLYRSVYGVFVYPEQGVGHHWPHAHIIRRGSRMASLHLGTGQLFDVVEAPPAAVLEEILADLDAILTLWEALNP